MKLFSRVTEIDPTEVMSQLDAAPELWGQHSLRKEIVDGAHSGMTDIWVRFADYSGDLLQMVETPHVPVWYPAWYKLQSLRAPILQLLRLANAEMLGGVLITKIPPGGKVLPHSDHSWHAKYYEKFFWSLQTAEGAVFGGACEEVGFVEEITPKTGEVYLFDNKYTHWVNNNSSVDRITCIVCLRRM